MSRTVLLPELPGGPPALLRVETAEGGDLLETELETVPVSPETGTTPSARTPSPAGRTSAASA